MKKRPGAKLLKNGGRPSAAEVMQLIFTSVNLGPEAVMHDFIARYPLPVASAYLNMLHSSATDGTFPELRANEKAKMKKFYAAMKDLLVAVDHFCDETAMEEMPEEES